MIKEGTEIKEIKELKEFREFSENQQLINLLKFPNLLKQ